MEHRRFDQGRARHSGGDAGGFKRTRPAPDVSPLLITKQLLIAVTSEQVFRLVQEALDNEARKHEGESTIISTVIACVESFPTKTATYALLVGYLAGRESTKHLAEKILLQSAERITTGRGRSERLLMRFLGASIRAAGLDITDFLDVLDALTNDEEDEREITKVKESQIFTAISVLPYITCSPTASRASEADEKGFGQRIQSVCDRLSRLKRQKSLPSKLAALTRAQQNRTDPNADRLALALAVAADGCSNRLLMMDPDFGALLIKNGPQLPTYKQVDFQLLKDSFLTLIERITAVVHEVAPVADDFNSAVLPLFPNGEPTEGLEIQRQPKSIERFLLREKALDIISSYAPKVNEAADALLSLSAPYVVVETVLSALLHMPTPEHSAIYYCDLLVKLCEKAPDVIPAPIEDALDQILILEPDDMDSDCLDRLALWLTMHLMAFDLDWPWIKWRNVGAMNERRSVRSLVEEIMQRLGALIASRAQLENPDKEIPDELLKMVPVHKPHGDSPYFAFNSPHLRLGEELIALNKSHPTVAQMSEFLNNKAPEPQWTTATRTSLVIQSALYVGHPSYTHTRAALVRIASPLNALGSNVDEAEERVVSNSAIDAVVAFWRSNSAWAIMTLGLLVDLKIAPISLVMNYLAERALTLSPYWRRRGMEDLLARCQSDEEKTTLIRATTNGDVDEATELWLSRRLPQ